MKVTGIRNKE